MCDCFYTYLLVVYVVLYNHLTNFVSRFNYLLSEKMKITEPVIRIKDDNITKIVVYDSTLSSIQLD